jgi:hypothetical protein
MLRQKYREHDQALKESSAVGNRGREGDALSSTLFTRCAYVEPYAPIACSHEAIFAKSGRIGAATSTARRGHYFVYDTRIK